jgi:hypothetical protein
MDNALFTKPRYRPGRVVSVVDPFYVLLSFSYGEDARPSSDYFNIINNTIEPTAANKYKLSDIHIHARDLKEHASEVVSFLRLLLYHTDVHYLTEFIGKKTIAGNDIIRMYVKKTQLVEIFIKETGIATLPEIRGMVCINDILKAYITCKLKLQGC